MLGNKYHFEDILGYLIKLRVDVNKRDNSPCIVNNSIMAMACGCSFMDYIWNICSLPRTNQNVRRNRFQTFMKEHYGEKRFYYSIHLFITNCLNLCVNEIPTIPTTDIQVLPLLVYQINTETKKWCPR